jgi:putative transposase
MRKFKFPGQAQRFLAAFGLIQDNFHPEQHQVSAKRYREQMCQRFQDWQEIIGLKPGA